MHSRTTTVKLTLAALAISSMFLAAPAFAADTIKGQVLGGGAPIAQSTVTLWAASSDAPKQIAQTKADNEGRFEVRTVGAPTDSSLYLTALGGIPAAHKSEGNNQAIALLAIVGNKPPARVVINEFTTIASVWTHAQFIDGMSIKAAPLQLRIAAGNVLNFVDLETGGWGGAIQDPLNSSQTPTMANFATLADLLSACVTRVKADACSSLFEAARPPSGGLPTDTLNTSESIALFPCTSRTQSTRCSASSIQFRQPITCLEVPYMPYPNWAPSAWVLPLEFTGGGYVAGGKCMFDSEGSLWQGGVARDFTILNTTCSGIPNSVQGYSFNFTVVPKNGQPLGYLTVWPKGQNQPVVSTLNAPTGTIVANAGILQAGTGGDIEAFASDNTDLIIDINGYFAAPASGGLSLYPAVPCRVIDTRKVGNGQPFMGELTVDVVGSACAPPSQAQAYVFNATVVPSGSLGYLTLWPDCPTCNQPLASTLNALDGAITSNMAIVPNIDGSTDAYASNLTQLILDISAYFAP